MLSALAKCASKPYHPMWTIRQPCPGIPSVGRTSTCPGRPSDSCKYNRCAPCCIALAGFDFAGCEDNAHRVHLNNASYSSPNYPPHDLPTIPYLSPETRLPIYSPRSGDFTCPAGFAHLELLGDNCHQFQQQLREQAEDRVFIEGFTAYVIIWSQVSNVPSQSECG